MSLTELGPQLDRNNSDDQRRGDEVAVVPERFEIVQTRMVHLPNLIGEEVY